MKDKRYKHAEDIIEDYIRLTDEQAEIPLSLEKAHKKWDSIVSDFDKDTVYLDSAEDAYKAFLQIKKCEERKQDIQEEFTEVEKEFKEFLAQLNGKKLAYERKDTIEKVKITYLFWYQDNMIKSNRQTVNK